MQDWKEYNKIIPREERNTQIIDHSQFQEMMIRAIEIMIGKTTITIRPKTTITLRPKTTITI